MSFVAVVLIGCGLHSIIFMRTRLYVSRFITRSADEVRRVVYGTALGALSFVFVAFVLQVQTSRAWVVLAFLSTSVFAARCPQYFAVMALTEQRLLLPFSGDQPCRTTYC